MVLITEDIFNSQFYIAQYKDVADAVATGRIKDPLEHFLEFGQFENRSPSIFFNSSYYLQQNPDVTQAIVAGKEESAIEHFIRHGQFESRNPSQLFDTKYYLQANADVQAGLTEGKVRSTFEHFFRHGQFEARTISRSFNSNYYLGRNPDVRQALQAGTFANAFQHYIQFGQYENRPVTPGSAPGSFVLQLLHASDFEAGIPALDDAPRFSSVLNSLRSQYPDRTLTLSSGDNYIPGPFLAASSDPSMRAVLGREDIGRGDITILNALGIQASVFGNHEFDQNTRQVRTLIAKDREYTGTIFPYLSANLNFAPDSNLRDLVVRDGQEASTIPNSIAKSTVITVGGQQFGIVGATTPTLRTISSPGDVGVSPSNPDDLDALAAAIQPSVDALLAKGINKVILLAHMQQLDIEVNLASRLRGVDIIVAGGSHTLLNDATDRLRAGDTSGGIYPIIRTSASGEPIAIVNTTSNYKYVGRLVAEFDSEGKLIPESIDPNISGAYATDEQGVADTGNVAPNPSVVQVTDALRNVVVSKDSQIFGNTNVYLNGERNSVRTEETNLGNLTADANISATRKVDPNVIISLKNGGGIRESIGAVIGSGGNDPNAGEKIPPVANPAAGKQAGEISLLDIENSLRFNNQLSLVTVTARQLQQVIEYGVADSAPGRTPGRFPQVGGMAFSFDPSKPAGSRVVSVAIKDSNGITTDVVVRNGQLVGNPDRTFRMVTLNFLADGGDGYPFPSFSATNRVDTGIGEQKALQDYLTEKYTGTPYTGVDTGTAQDTRIQNLSARTDTVLSGVSLALRPSLVADPVDSNDLLTGDSDRHLFQTVAVEDIVTNGGRVNNFLDDIAAEAKNPIAVSSPGLNPNLVASISPVLSGNLLSDPYNAFGCNLACYES